MGPTTSRGAPVSITVDNGPEFQSKAMDVETCDRQCR
jgi:hypothetical protein